MARRSTPRHFLGLESLEARRVLSTVAPGGPGAREQYLLEQINALRTNPAAVAKQYTSNLDAETMDTINHYGVDLNSLRQKLSTTPAQPPVAWDASLAAAAVRQSSDQAAGGFQSHTGSDGSNPGSRATAAGFRGTGVIENAFAYANSVDNAMDAFVIDWGTDGGHFRNLLQPGVAPADASTHVGLGVVDSHSGVGPLVVTQDFGKTPGELPTILGAVYTDADGNGAYSMNEGVGGAQVVATNVATGAAKSANTWQAGGYQIEVPAGTYDVVASVEGREIGRQRIDVGSLNRQIDFAVGAAPQSNYDPSAQAAAQKAAADALAAQQKAAADALAAQQKAAAAKAAADALVAQQQAAAAIAAQQIAPVATPAPTAVAQPMPISAPVVVAAPVIIAAPVVVVPSQPVAVAGLPFGSGAVVIKISSWKASN